MAQERAKCATKGLQRLLFSGKKSHMRVVDGEKPQVFTIGYQGRDVPGLIQVLAENGVALLVDVREKPYGRKVQFNRRALSGALAVAGIEYAWMGDRLGGFTCSRDDWLAGCAVVAQWAQSKSLVLMCLERSVKACHRQKLAEILAQEHGIGIVNL